LIEHALSERLEGLVVSAHGRHVVVEALDGSRLRCHTRGKHSELVVGDHVQWQPSGDEGIVTGMLPRRSELHRQDAWRTKRFAANVDQIIIMVAVVPPFSDEQLTRTLVAAADAGVPLLVLCNKIDLPDAQATLTRLDAYRASHVEVLPLALKPRANDQAAQATEATMAAAQQALAPRLHGRVSLIVGPSGVGKSTLVNLLVPSAQAQVGEISLALNAGKHTTTASRWYWIDRAQGTALIDTPGFQQFGLHHIAPDRLAALMPDVQAHAKTCKFYNCTHRQEPGCGVLAAVASGALNARRHGQYVALRTQLEAGQP
jgi:ribosome biogenesis GTPase / thiamine phosphate phosphatase